MRKLEIRSQLAVDREARRMGVWDDCGPSSAAAAASWVLGKTITAREGIAAKERATGKADVQGVSDNGSSLWDLLKTVKVLGANGRFPATWGDAISAGKRGAALIVNVSNGLSPFYDGVKMSRWHRRLVKKNPGANGYGHMVAFAYDPEIGWQFADPTMSGSGTEIYAVPVTEAQVRSIASSKGDAPKGRTLIVRK
jgi:hypothetical protein